MNSPQKQNIFHYKKECLVDDPVFYHMNFCGSS